MKRLAGPLFVLAVIGLPGVAAAAPTTYAYAGAFPTGSTSAGHVAVAPSGNVFVLDASPSVREFSPAGAPIATWGSAGADPGQFSAPSDITVGGDGAVYVADLGNRRVQKFSASGDLLDARWAGVVATSITAAGDGTIFAAGDAVVHLTAAGRPLQQFGSSAGPIEAGAGGEVFESSLAGMLRLGADGTLLRTIGAAAGDGVPITRGKFDVRPDGAAWTGATLWVADPLAHRLQQFQPDGRFLQACGAQLLGRDFAPSDVAVSPVDGALYAVQGSSVTKFSPDGSAGPMCRDATPSIAILGVERARSSGSVVVRLRSATPAAVSVSVSVRRTGVGAFGGCRTRSSVPRGGPRCHFYRKVTTRDLTVTRDDLTRTTTLHAVPGVLRVDVGATDASGEAARSVGVRVPSATVRFDRDFGDRGVLRRVAPIDSVPAADAVADAHGRLLILAPGGAAVTRLTSSGRLDRHFGTSGRASVDPPHRPDEYVDLIDASFG